MADSRLCPADEDSGLSITSNITGIMTFCVAVILGAWLRFHTWTSAEREFEEFEKYIHMHKIELNWMRDLLSETVLDGSAKHATRPLPVGHISSGRPLSPTLEREHPRDRYKNKALKDLDWKDKWRKIAYAAVKRSRNDRAVIEAVQQEIRCSRMKRKRDRRDEIAERDRNLFGRIFKMIDQLDRSLQTIVDNVRRQSDIGEDLLMIRSGIPGWIPSERSNPRTSMLVAEIVEPESSGLGSSVRINSAPELMRASQLNGDVGPPRRHFSEGSLDIRPPRGQNFMLQPMQAVLRTRTQPPQQHSQHIEHGVLPTSELRVPQSPHLPTSSALPVTAVASEQQGRTANGSARAAVPAVEFRTPQPFREGLDGPKEPKLPPSFTSRVADHIQSNFPDSWFSKYYVAWNWLRKREEAWKLRKERDIQWNRVHASQLALLTRRIEDQDEQLDLLDFHITLHNRLISRASWTRARR